MALAGCSTGEASDPSAIKVRSTSAADPCTSSTGTGTPTIVMDAGLGNSHTTWAKVVPDVRGANRTCTYDRAKNPDGLDLEGSTKALAAAGPLPAVPPWRQAG